MNKEFSLSKQRIDSKTVKENGMKLQSPFFHSLSVNSFFLVLLSAFNSLFFDLQERKERFFLTLYLLQ